jgi:hypothetical protein
MMRSLSCLGLLAVVALASTEASVRAQIYAGYGQPAVAPVVPVTPGLPDIPQTVPVLPTPAMLPVRPLTVNEFVGAFKPLPGQYQVLLIHPKTGCPVKVCFTLKPGCIRKVRVNSHKIDFVYARQCDVVIRFLHSGKVWVRD